MPKGIRTIPRSTPLGSDRTTAIRVSLRMWKALNKLRLTPDDSFETVIQRLVKAAKTTKTAGQ